MRLIDAGELKERFCEENCGKNRCVDHMDKCAWILSVEESKTAFDVDKVVESLMNRFRVVSNDDSELTINHYLMRSVIINSLFLDILIIGMVLFMNRQLYGYFSYVLQGIQVVVIIVSAFMVMCKRDGRGIQDYLGNTKVIMCNEE